LIGVIGSENYLKYVATISQMTAAFIKKHSVLRGGSENRRLPLEQFTCDLAKALARGLMSLKHVLRNVHIARRKNIDMDKDLGENKTILL